MIEIETLFGQIDGFCQVFSPIFESHLLPNKIVKYIELRSLSWSEYSGDY